MSNDYLVDLPIKSFSELWAEGKFDDVDYYALTAPLVEWSACPSYHCLSEPAPGICDENWGIVTWKLTVYVYSSKEKANLRAKMLGGNVKPLKLNCLSCFARVFSKNFSYVDMVLDESWHVKSYVCREIDYNSPGVSHIRISLPEGLYQLQGCSASSNLEWIQYPSYSEPNQPEEWCRPVSFPGYMVMYDHSAQGGPADVEFLHDPEGFNYINVDGVEFAIDSTENSKTLFTRPTGPVAFANLMQESVRLTNGEGAWIPLCNIFDEEYVIFSWAQDYKPYIDKILNGEVNFEHFDRGCKWFINRAMTLLENEYLGKDMDEDYGKEAKTYEENRTKVLKEAMSLLAKAVESKPWDWYAIALLKDLKTLTPEEVPALIHADRCAWLLNMGFKEQMEEEFNIAISAKPNYHLALYFRASAYRFENLTDAYIESLENLLKFHPKHAQTLFDLGVAACSRGDEATEMRYYAKAIEADPTFAPPYFNTGKTHEDNGEEDEAKEYYEKALHYNPYYVESSENLAMILWSAGEYDEAVKLILRNIVAEPRRLQTYQNLIQVARILEDAELMSIAYNALKANLPRYARTVEQGYKI